MRANRPLLLGHRGARATSTIPENTFASFDLALEQGCDGFEFDVRLTRDERELICHDPQYKGITIADVATGQLQELPTLPAVIERYQKRAFLDIELKVPGLERRTAELLRNSELGHGCVLSSFLPEVVRELRGLGEAIPIGLICESRQQLALWNKLPLTHIMPHHKLMTQLLIEEAHAAGLKVFVWTVNQRDQMQRLADSGVDGIISDDTALLVRTLKNRES
jgi:glycerophosphoryl diester phosphodiesterase